MQLPELWRYQALLAQRDQGMMLVVMVVVICVGLLTEARFLSPRLLPGARVGLLAAFYLSLFLILIVKAFNA